MIGRINLKIQLNQSSAYIEIRLNMRRSAWMVILGLENSGGIQLQTSEEERHAISLVVILKCFLFKRPTGVESDELHWGRQILPYNPILTLDKKNE